MASARDVIVIGAGHNGLVAAGYLAKAGYRPLVLERRDVVGGVAVTEEIHPGFRCPTVMHVSGLLPKVARDLELARFGLETIVPPTRVFAADLDGRSVRVTDDPAATAASVSALSKADGAAYPEFCQSFARIGRALGPLLLTTPPSIDHPSASDAWNFAKLGKDFRGLGKRDGFRLLRWGPMAVADLAAEWFETELLRAIVAARGIYGAFAGPWSAGTSAALLLQAAADGSALAPATTFKGGIGALTTALADAAKAAGADVRTGAEVARVIVKDGRAAGVVLASGEEIAARAVVSNADPKHTLLGLVDPIDLEPDFVWKVRNYRSTGTAAKVNLAVSALPAFTALKGSSEAAVALSGRIHVGPEIDALERAFDAAKYGEMSAEPYLDVTIPSIADPSLAPAAKHVVSIHAQFAPYALRQGDWSTRREELGDVVVRTLAAYAPGLETLVLARQVLTPLDLEATFGLTGGHLLHGEPALDQLFTFRPLIGWAQYRTPVAGLYLCGSGTHPGGGISGAPGANAAREVAKDLKSARR